MVTKRIAKPTNGEANQPLSISEYIEKRYSEAAIHILGIKFRYTYTPKLIFYQILPPLGQSHQVYKTQTDFPSNADKTQPNSSLTHSLYTPICGCRLSNCHDSTSFYQKVSVKASFKQFFTWIKTCVFFSEEIFTWINAEIRVVNIYSEDFP